MSEMEKGLSSAMSDYDAAASNLARTRAKIASNRKRLDELGKAVETGQKRLASEVVFLYRTDGNGFAEALLSAPSIEDFASRLLALSRIANRDAETISRMRRDRAAAAATAKQLQQREAEQAALLKTVSARRSKAQQAVDAQQRYADSLPSQVSDTLNKETTASGKKAPTPKPVNRFSLAWAKVDGRSGKYAVLGNQPKAYAPSGIVFKGKATWYGNYRPNMRTASGRAFNENEFTCAHKTLPFGTRVAVTYKGKRVIVIVTDRGPYGKGRVIDLTKRAASVIGMKSAGVGSVTCEVVRAK